MIGVLTAGVRWVSTATAAFLLSGSLLWTPSVKAATVNVSASATVMDPAQVTADAASQWQSSVSFGVLLLSIPAVGGAAASAPLTMTLSASGEVVWDRQTVFSSRDGVGLAALISQMAISGASLSTSGTLSGSGVHIVVISATQGSDGGTVTAVVNYN